MEARTPPVTPAERLSRIVEDGMCIGCGLCQSIAGPDRVRVTKVKSGHERPVVVGPLDHETVDRIYDACPGTRLEGLPERLVDRETRHDLVWGPHRRMVLAHATDPEVRHLGATGGVLTALALHLVESGKVDFVLHVKASAKHPTFGEHHTSATRADVLAAAGSRYGPSAPLADIHRALDRDRPFAFIGKPCDIAALRNLARADDRVDRLVTHWLALVCGGFMEPRRLEQILREKRGVSPDQLTGLRYRGHGCPGKTRYTLADGTAGELRYTDLWGTDVSQWGLPFRCKVCPDGIGEAADLAAADNWPGGSPDPETEDADPGTNAVVVRTKAGERLMADAEATGHLTVLDEVTPRHMDAVQPHQVTKKRAARARWDGMAAEGRTVPRSARLRLDSLAETLGEEGRRAQTEGTRRRVREGKADEPAPEPED